MKMRLAALALALGAALVGCSATPSQHLVPIHHAADQAKQAKVTIDAGLSALSLQAADDGLVTGLVHTYIGETVDQNRRFRGDTVELVIRQQGRKLTLDSADPESGIWKLGLTDKLPMALTVTANTGPLEADLSHLTLSSLEMHTDGAESEITLPRQGRFAAVIKANTGSKVIRIPDGMAARITVKRPVGLRPVVVEGDFHQAGDVYTSPGFDTAPNRVELRLEAGVAEIRVVAGE